MVVVRLPKDYLGRSWKIADSLLVLLSRQQRQELAMAICKELEFAAEEAAHEMIRQIEEENK